MARLGPVRIGRRSALPARVVGWVVSAVAALAASVAPLTVAAQAAQAAVAALAMAAAFAAVAASPAPAAAGEGRAYTAAAATLAPEASPDKRCRAAVRKVQREQQRLDSVDGAIAGTQRGRQRCASKRACARLDGELQVMERQKARQVQRLERFGAVRATACAQQR